MAASPRPEAFHVAEARYFGVPASGALFAVGSGCLVLGAVLLALGYILSGALLLVAALAFFALFVSAVRTRRDGAVARQAFRLATAVRSSATFAAQRLVTHGSTRLALGRVEREIAALRAERDHALRDLGEAAYGGDRAATKAGRARVEELDRQISEKGEEMQALVAEMQARLDRARRETQATEIQPTPPAPPQIPEPTPEPHRPPIPPDTPDPAPEPHRPPSPPQIPEPSPEPSIRG